MKKEVIYRPLILFCLVLCHFSLPLTLAQTCPKQCDCFKSNIHCPSPSFPIVLPARNVSLLSIQGNFHTLPKNAVVQPKKCFLARVMIYKATIFDVEPYCMSGLKTDTLELLFSNIVNLQAKAFANITCKTFLIEYSNINALLTIGFYGLSSEQLSISYSNLTLVSLNTSYLITVDNINISDCYICKLDTQLPVRNQSMTITRNIILSFDSNATVGGLFYENQIFCSCNLFSEEFINVIYKNYLFDNTCFDPPHLKGIPLIDVNQSEICNQSHQQPVQCRIHTNSNNSSSEFFKINQLLIFFLVFVVISSVYHL